MPRFALGPPPPIPSFEGPRRADSRPTAHLGPSPEAVSLSHFRPPHPSRVQPDHRPDIESLTTREFAIPRFASGDREAGRAARSPAAKYIEFSCHYSMEGV